jgi:protein-disulfide isomerase
MPRNHRLRKQIRPGHQLFDASWKRWIGYGALVVALAAALFFATARPQAQPLAQIRLASDPSLGPGNAKVTIVEYGDFGCPTCQGWYRAGVLNQLMATYRDKIRFVWKDFPIITAESPKAAEAGQCAFDQGKFWLYHDLLYEKAPALSVPDLKNYAAQAGLSTAVFNHCLDSGQDAAKVQQSLNEAQQQYAFPGTPSFLVNGKELIGPATLDTFRSMIDPILAGG